MVLILLLLPFTVFSSELMFFERSSYDRLLGYAREARIIYLGEVHNRKDIHELQLRIIKDLHSEGFKLAILMEAFQQQFQDALDEFVEGEIDEEEMLRRTEYIKRWRFDKELYAPLWRFAKENYIRLFALNVPSELLRETRNKGVKGVVSRYIPRRVMLFHEQHRRFLEKAMGKHKGASVERFMNVQLTWDMGMAYRIAKLVTSNPDTKFVVIVGSGHVWRGYGIPERVNFLIGEVPQLVSYLEEDDIHFLFSKDFSKESSSTNSRSEPN